MGPAHQRLRSVVKGPCAAHSKSNEAAPLDRLRARRGPFSHPTLTQRGLSVSCRCELAQGLRTPRSPRWAARWCAEPRGNRFEGSWRPPAERGWMWCTSTKVAWEQPGTVQRWRSRARTSAPEHRGEGLPGTARAGRQLGADCRPRGMHRAGALPQVAPGVAPHALAVSLGPWWSTPIWGAARVVVGRVARGHVQLRPSIARAVTFGVRVGAVWAHEGWVAVSGVGLEACVVARRILGSHASAVGARGASRTPRALAAQTWRRSLHPRTHQRCVAREGTTWRRRDTASSRRCARRMAPSPRHWVSGERAPTPNHSPGKEGASRSPARADERARIRCGPGAGGGQILKTTPRGVVSATPVQSEGIGTSAPDSAPPMGALGS